MSRRAVTRGLDLVIGGALIVGSASFLLGDRGAVLAEIAQLPGIDADRTGVVLAGVVAAVETYLGLQMALRPRARTRLACAVLLGLFQVALVVAGATRGWELRCACFGVLFTQSLAAAVLRNCGLLAVLVLAHRLDGSGQASRESSESP